MATGTARLTLSPVLGRVVLPRLPVLAQRHPRLRVDLSVTDRLVKLGAEGIDVAVRIGGDEDATLAGRQLARPRWVTVAAPSYLGARGVPKSVPELASHDTIAFVTPNGATRTWDFASGKGKQGRFTPGTRLSIDSGELLVDAAVSGLGIAQVFDFMVLDHLRAGRLVEVLASSAVAGPPIRALTVASRRHVPRVRALLDFLTFAFTDALRPAAH